MKRFVGLLAFLSGLSSFAGQGVHILTCSTQGAHVSTGISTVPANYSLLWPSQALVLTKPYLRNLSVENRTDSGIAVTFSNNAWVTPAASTITNPTQYFIAPSSSGALVMPQGGGAQYLYLRASNMNNSSLTCKGDIFINAW